jgi:hypothetical protein
LAHTTEADFADDVTPRSLHDVEAAADYAENFYNLRGIEWTITYQLFAGLGLVGAAYSQLPGVLKGTTFGGAWLHNLRKLPLRRSLRRA